MNYTKLKKLREKLYFTSQDVADVLAVQRTSGLVACNRYTRQGIFVRVKRNLYTLEENWKNYSQTDFLKLSNILQVPSYISLVTALSFYEVTTQVPQNYFESISLKRSAEYTAPGARFIYHKLKKQFYFDFMKKDGIFIASKEKAFLDILYLNSYGKYRVDFNAIDINKLEIKRIKELRKKYPLKTKKLIEEKCKI